MVNVSPSLGATVLKLREATEHKVVFFSFGAKAANFALMFFFVCVCVCVKEKANKL